MWFGIFKGILSTAILVGLFACAATPTTVPVTPITVPTAPVVALDDDVLVMYHKTGGIAGVDETLTVHQGGLAEWSARNGAKKSLQLSEPTLEPLRRMVEQDDFGKLAPLYQAAGADLFVYTITARDSNGTPKTVTTMDLAKNPDYLGLLVVTLENLRATVAKNG